jgi:branched-chain amino acid transport system ATP-binding protein
VSLIGSNGAGKTTFVNMITGYVRPDSGRIWLGGTDITRMNPRQIIRMGVARSFQIPQLYPSMTVLENMLVALACHQGRLSTWLPAATSARVLRADEVLSRFNLLKHRDRLVSELPGGLRKLIDIALAMTGAPRLLLLDEPTSGVAAEENFP